MRKCGVFMQVCCDGTYLCVVCCDSNVCMVEWAQLDLCVCVRAREHIAGTAL